MMPLEEVSSTETTRDVDGLIEDVKKWGREHKIFDPMSQYAKVNEEVGEIAHELTRNNLHSAEIADAVGDTLVTVIILADILDIDPVLALAGAYNTIKNRKGHTENGSFIKEGEGE